jgi:hypothetical protein
MSTKGILNGANGGASSMRLSLVLAAIGAFVIMLTIAAYIIISAIKEVNPEWATMGVFTIGVAAILTGVGYTKVLQKETELKHETKKE